MERTRTRKKKKTDLQVYHLKETDRFLKLTEKLDYTRPDNSRILKVITYTILYSGSVTVTTNATEYNSSNEVVWHDFRILDKFTIPKRRFVELKKWVRKGLPYQTVNGPLIPSSTDYFKRYNDECFKRYEDKCFTRCTIHWYTGFKNHPIKKVVNDYELTYPFILSFIRPFSKLDRLIISSLPQVRENIINYV